MSQAVPLGAVRFPYDAPRTFDLRDEEDNLQHIPFHRMRRALRNGRITRERHPPDDQRPGLPASNRNAEWKPAGL